MLAPKQGSCGHLVLWILYEFQIVSLVFPVSCERPRLDITFLAFHSCWLCFLCGFWLLPADFLYGICSSCLGTHHHGHILFQTKVENTDPRSLCLSKCLQEFKHRPKMSGEEFKRERLIFGLDFCFLACPICCSLLSILLDCYMLLSELLLGVFGGLWVTQAMEEVQHSQPSQRLFPSDWVVGFYPCLLFSVSEPRWCFCSPLPGSLLPSSHCGLVVCLDCLVLISWHGWNALSI